MTTKRKDGAYACVLSDFNKTVERYSMLERFMGGVLVGFSGGADSVMLLSLMKGLSDKHGFPLCAMHVNHMIRGSEADRDEQFCRDFCERLSVELAVEKIDVPSLAKKEGRSIEDAARRARYTAFNRMLDVRSDLSCIVTAHNSSDNAETVIFNMLRGGGSRALSGIPVVRDNVLRPIILSTKADIVSAVNEQGLLFVTDSTNADTDYTRNYIRAEILPKMSRITPMPERAIARMCENVAADSTYIDSVAAELVSEKGITNTAERELLSSLHPAILHRVLSVMRENAFGDTDAFLERKHFDSILSAIKKGDVNFSIDLSGCQKFVCDRGICSFELQADGEDAEFCIPLKMGENRLPDGSLIYLSDTPCDEFSEKAKNVYKLSIQAAMSFDTMDISLTARSRRDGDSILMGKMTKKLKTLYNGKKIPIAERRLLPIICECDRLVWLPRLGVADFARKGERAYNVYAYFFALEEK